MNKKNKQAKLKKDSKKQTFSPVNSKKNCPSIEIAMYYGFRPIETPKIEKIDKENTKNLKEGKPITVIGSNEKIEILAEEKSAILRNYFTANMQTVSQPVMLAYNNFINEKNQKTTTANQKVGLEIIGSDKSIIEAVLIKTALAILEENGLDDLYVEINSIGDRESYNKFLRELTLYFRKNINSMPTHCQQTFKKDPALVLKCQNEKCFYLIDNAPKSIGCLSDNSREHFKEVLEYFESLDIPYKINNCLIPDHRYASGTVFEIKQKSENLKNIDRSLAIGFRSDEACKKLGFKKEIPMIGVKLDFKTNLKKRTTPKIKKSSIFFIQLGDEAKHKSLRVIDILRKENIHINYSLGRDKMAGQMAVAERLKVPYILIMGKKEAMDETIMIRNVSTRSQETVKITELATYLKKLVK